MGKKYIVEIGKLERLYKAYVNGNGKPNLTLLSPEVDLTPYTEPDLERVKKTAHDDGYSKGYQAGREDLNRVMSDVEQIRKEAYAEGLKDGKAVTLANEQNNAFNDGYKKCLDDMELVKKEEYDRGYNDGYQSGPAEWELARRIIRMPECRLPDIFTECYPSVCTADQVILKYTATEAIVKIEAWEEEQAQNVSIELTKSIQETVERTGVSLDKLAAV